MLKLEDLGLQPNPVPLTPFFKADEFFYPGIWDKQAGCCRLELYRSDDHKLYIIVTERDDNPGASITNAIEHVMLAVRQQVLCNTLEKESDLVLIEHYAQSTQRDFPETFSLVIFEKAVPGEHYARPQWFQLTRAEVDRLLGVGK